MNSAGGTRGSDISQIFDGNTGAGFAWHVNPAAFPGEFAIHFGGAYSSGVRINALEWTIHENSFGDYELYGSDDSGTGANFHSSGTWDLIGKTECQSTSDIKIKLLVCRSIFWWLAVVSTELGIAWRGVQKC